MGDEKVADGEALLDEAAGKVRRRLDALLRGEEVVSTGDGGAPAGAPVAEVGPYRVKRELGSGGMGTVLLAERTDGVIERDVAVKLIRGFPTEEGKRRLRQERQVLADLDHPAIARLLDGGETPEGQPYLVMEYVEGRGLLEHVKDAGLDASGRIQLWQEIAEAVAHAHQRLVVHRDLKPSNVRVRPDGHPKLLDFGVAKLGVLSESEANTSTRVFTPGYAAPEQESGGAITTRTDVHALGTMLRELMLGLRGDDRPSSTPVPPVPLAPDLAAIVAKARSTDPKERYSTVDAMQEDVRRFEAGLPVSARPGHPVSRAAKWVWRNRGTTALVAAALLIVAGFVFQLKEGRDQALEAERVAVAARASAEQEARRARALLDFVVGTFEAAAPEQTLGQKLTVRQLLGAAEGRLEKHRGPDRAALVVLLGQLYGGLGDRTNTIRLAGTATVALGTPKEMDEARLLVSANLILSNALTAARRSEDGLRAAERALELWRQWLADDVALGREIKRFLGQAYSNTYNHEAAEKIMREVLTSTPADPAVAIDERVDALSTLCTVATRTGRLDEAAASSRRLSAVVASLPADHPHRVTALRAEGDVHTAGERWPQAYAAYQAAIALQSTLSEGKGDILATLYNELGIAAFRGGNFRLAYEAIGQAIAVVPPEDLQGPDRAMRLTNLSALADFAGDYPRALALLDEAVVLGRNAWVPDEFHEMRGTRGRILALLGRFDEGRAELLSARSQLSAEAADRRAILTVRLGQLEQWAQRAEAAERYFKEGEAALPPGPESARMQRTVDRGLAVVAVQRGRAVEALERFDRLLGDFEESYGPDSTNTWMLRAERASALALAGRAEEARQQLDAAIPKLEQAMRPTAYNLAQAIALRRRLGPVKGE